MLLKLEHLVVDIMEALRKADTKTKRPMSDQCVLWLCVISR